MDVNLAESCDEKSSIIPKLSPTIERTLGLAVPTTSCKTLKRCLSVPHIRTLPSSPLCTATMTTRSAAAAAAAIASCNRIGCGVSEHLLETPKKNQYPQPDSSTGSICNFGNNIHIGIPRSNPSSREVSPAPVFNIFAPRARRYSASYSPLGAATVSVSAGATGSGLCLTPRVSQLRQEECADINSREVNHEREVHSVMQMSQSWEDLTLVAENWSCKSDEFSNPLQVMLPSGVTSCSSPSPTSHRTGLRLPYGLSPSPTRRTFATRRSMSPIAMRPSQLGPVKRKFELDDNTSSNWNYSAPPAKKIFTESRGSSPVCQSPSSVCPSPDSGTYDGRNTPKFFISKLCTTNTNTTTSSACSSPMSASPSSSGIGSIDSTANAALCSSSSSSTTSSMMGGSEPMISIDEGISISETDEKPSQQHCPRTTTPTVQPMSTDIQDEITLMDDNKSETSSIGGCSSISLESSSCDSGARTTTSTAAFFNRLLGDDVHISSLSQKNFFINKQGCAKKYIVNHDNLPNSSSEHFDSISSTTSATNRTADAEEDGSDTLMCAANEATNTTSPTVVVAASVIVENKL